MIDETAAKEAIARAEAALEFTPHGAKLAYDASVEIRTCDCGDTIFDGKQRCLGCELVFSPSKPHIGNRYDY